MVLAAWAGLFWFLLLSGRDDLYLSTRTIWVVPIGAVGFAVSVGDVGSGPLTLIDVASAQFSKPGELALAKRAGEQVEFVGFVTRYPDTPADEFLLTRFIVTCCVADATIAQVRVVNVPPGRFETNDWVEVRGPIYPLGREVIVNASSIEAVPRPDRPYLTP